VNNSRTSEVGGEAVTLLGDANTATARRRSRLVLARIPPMQVRTKQMVRPEKLQ